MCGSLVSVALVPQAGWPIGFWVIFLSPLHSAEIIDVSHSVQLSREIDLFLLFICVCV